MAKRNKKLGTWYKIKQIFWRMVATFTANGLATIGAGSLIGIDGLFKFSENWKFEFELFKNSNKEPVADWINSNNSFGNYTNQLDGESFNGTGFFAEIRRETQNWRTFFASSYGRWRG